MLVSVAPFLRSYAGGMQERRSVEYFERRAKEERAAAAGATNARAAQSHHELAERYRQLAAGAELPAGDVAHGDDAVLPRDFRIVP